MTNTIEKATINFPGVLPNEDDFTGHWVLTDRIIVIPFSERVSESEDKETRVLQALRDGTFEVQILEWDTTEYIGDVLDKEEIISVANESTSYQKFYDEIINRLHSTGYDAYVEEYGREIDSEDEDSEANEYLDENGVNGEAFREIMCDQYSNSTIFFEGVE